MDPESGVVSASLGQLALHYGLLSSEEHSATVAELRNAAQSGQPDSCARLLIRRGIAQRAVSHLLSLGAELAAVLCDACGEALPQGELARRQAYSCPRCSSQVFGFRAFSTDRLGAVEDSEETTPLAHEPPATRESSETDRYDMVLPLPNDPSLRPGAGRDLFAATLREQEEVEPDMNQTLGFPQVFALPSNETQLTDHDATMVLEAMLQPVDARNAETLMASAADLGLNLMPPPPKVERERPRIPEHAPSVPTSTSHVDDDPALWPWVLALALLTVATAVALGFALYL